MSEVWLECVDCSKKYSLEKKEARYRCDCQGLLQVQYDFSTVDVSRKLFDSRLGSKRLPFSSGVWRFRELIHPLVSDKQIVSRPEGNTNLYSHSKLSRFTGVKSLRFKHEGENPTGSFKDRGMCVGISEAVRLGAKSVACASTGNTSASLASYSSLCGLRGVVFIPQGEIAFGKLAQSIAYGSRVLQVKGNFDSAMSLVQDASQKLGLYLLNSVNPWRIEGQKAIAFEMCQQLDWNPPDWVVLPAGNLGNTSALGKGFSELKQLGLIDSIPRIASIQADGANPFYQLFSSKSKQFKPVLQPHTIASAIKIGNPVSWKKALSVIKQSRGTVEQVSDQEIMDAKAMIDSSGIGCEPASAASAAGLKKLVERGIIKSDESAVCILTGHLLKDPQAVIYYHSHGLEGILPHFANEMTVVEPTVQAVEAALKN